MSLNIDGVLFGLDFDIIPMKANISKVMVENEVVEGYFYMVSLDFGMSFLSQIFW